MWQYTRKKGNPLTAVVSDDVYEALPPILKLRLYPAPEGAEKTHVLFKYEDEGGIYTLTNPDNNDKHQFVNLGTEQYPTENYVVPDPLPEPESKAPLKFVAGTQLTEPPAGVQEKQETRTVEERLQDLEKKMAEI